MKMFVEPPAIYLHKAPVDFRKSINGLSAIVESEMALSPFSGALFIFAIANAISSRLCIGIKQAFACGTSVLRKPGSNGRKRCQAAPFP